jgi:hypothetical protein
MLRMRLSLDFCRAIFATQGGPDNRFTVEASLTAQAPHQSVQT